LRTAGSGYTTNDNSDTITLSIGANPGGSTLSGTLTVTVVGGVATFADLSIDMAGSSYTLAANGAGLPALTSAGFAINPAAADHLVFLQQPADTAAGQGSLAKQTAIEGQRDHDPLNHGVGSDGGGASCAGRRVGRGVGDERASGCASRSIECNGRAELRFSGKKHNFPTERDSRRNGAGAGSSAGSM
jgi:hypothetical protein